jgi:hypothetical protein
VRAFAVASLLVALVGLASSSFAGESGSRMKQAQTLFVEGVEAGKQEDWSRALELFRRSQEIVDRPSTSFNIASALMRLDRLEEAVDAFEHFLVIADADKDAELSSQAAQRIEEAKRMIAERTPKPEPKVDETPPMETKPVPEAKLQPIEPAPEEPEKAALVPETDPRADVKAKTERDRSSGSILASPIFWIVAGVVIVGAAVATSVLLSSPGEKMPYAGTAGTVLRGLE